MKMDKDQKVFGVSVGVVGTLVALIALSGSETLKSVYQ